MGTSVGVVVQSHTLMIRQPKKKPNQTGSKKKSRNRQKTRSLTGKVENRQSQNRQISLKHDL